MLKVPESQNVAFLYHRKYIFTSSELLKHFEKYEISAAVPVIGDIRTITLYMTIIFGNQIIS